LLFPIQLRNKTTLPTTCEFHKCRFTAINVLPALAHEKVGPVTTAETKSARFDSWKRG